MPRQRGQGVGLLDPPGDLVDLASRLRAEPRLVDVVVLVLVLVVVGIVGVVGGAGGALLVVVVEDGLHGHGVAGLVAEGARVEGHLAGRAAEALDALEGQQAVGRTAAPVGHRGRRRVVLVVRGDGGADHAVVRGQGLGHALLDLYLRHLEAHDCSIIFQTCKKLFIKFSTTLPTSASVGRLFSAGGLILNCRRLEPPTNHLSNNFS